MIIVLVHEWGHFFVARKCGVFVEEFAFGMGPKLFGHTSKKGTLYSFRVFPLGGFCRMKGEEESVDEAGSYSNCKIWQRIAIVAAGPIMNFVLALVLLMIFTGIYGYADTRVASVEENYPAMAAGLEPGDRLYRLNGDRIHTYSEFSYEMSFNQGETIELMVEKADGHKETLMITPQLDETENRYRLGFSVGGNGGSLSDILKRDGADAFFATIGKMVSQSFWTMCFDVEMVVRGFVQMLTGRVSMNDVSGPIGIVSVLGETYRMGLAESILAALSNVASMIILLSVNLGVLNLFPIPALDGSRILFLLIEKIRGKKMNERLENMIYLIGFLLLIGLMAVIAVNDIAKLFR